MNKTVILLALASVSLSQAAPSETAVRTSANKAVQLMERSIGALAPNIPCASCHHNNMPLWGLSIAKDHGIQVNAELSHKVAVHTYSFLKDVDRAVQGTTFVDPGIEGGELLAFAGSVGVKPSLTTALQVRRMASLQHEDGHWATFDARPPQTGSLFMVTALNLKALSDHMPPSLRQERDERIAKAHQWLLNHQPVSVEDASFRLLGLKWAGASPAELQTAAKSLLDTQTADGSWAQVPGRTSDAYGTGEALAALKLTGMAPADAYNRGIEWLLKAQLEDGSWLVKTRLHEVAPISPPYMETGFPHGKDQIVSMLGTTWAVMALSLSLPEHRMEVAELTEVKPVADSWIEAAAFGSTDALKSIEADTHTAAGTTLLMVVANDSAKVKAMIDRGADVKQRAKSGHTALTVAATYKGSAPVLRQLVAKGADAVPVKEMEFHSNPLVYATYAGDLEAVRILLDNGANATQTMMLAGMVPMNPVSAAVHFDNPVILGEFLKRGVDPNMVDEVPLLSMAAAQNRPAVAKLLLASGADPNRKDKYGWTPLRHARAIEHDAPVVEGLIEAALKKVELSQNVQK